MNTCFNVTESSLQRFGADLQVRVKAEFRALHQILDDEESCMLEQLRREQEDELEKIQRHREAVKLAVRELEENMRVLQQASASTENMVLTEVRAKSLNVFERLCSQSSCRAISSSYLKSMSSNLICLKL